MGDNFSKSSSLKLLGLKLGLVLGFGVEAASEDGRTMVKGRREASGYQNVLAEKVIKFCISW